MLQEHTRLLATLTAQKNQLEETISELKANILAEMKADGLTSYKDEAGTVSYVTRKNYKYTEAVKKMEEAVKLKKVEEEETGKAQVSVTEYVQISLPKS